ncbi:hypothetical protein VI817_000030 [Penicillium citrinum]|uniref:Cytochrome b561 domain-containing protein n=1 Tax=Penicillium hetheringtonii TaxID=911720 RepID=A0AAD6E2Q4_9EURO|nr:hypothetical protein N7450_000030 [Penicillium hetheringtonii]KAK5805772.1 hypothetical protein VI817_000030 [Penicillium citrinum]
MAWSIYLGLFCFALAGAQFQSIVPEEHPDIKFTIHVSADAAKNGSGPIFFQMNSSRPVQWFALAQGIHMRDSNMFIAYTSSRNNNVTVSPRIGKGHFLPLYNPKSNISILEGSGIHNGIMTANVRCDSCLFWDGGHENLMNPSSPWIWGVKYGSPLRSDSMTMHLLEHDDDGVAFVNMRSASGTNSTMNPFLNLDNSTITPAWNRSPFDSIGLNKKKIAHAILMTVVFVTLFPFAAMTLHLFPSSSIVLVHAFLQLFNLVIAIAGLAVGISMSRQIHLMRHHHPIIGIIVVASLVLFQPALGLLQHRHFHKTGGKGIFAYLHRWLGRSMIVLGIINVGLGFQLTGWRDPYAPRGAVITCSVVSGVVGVIYVFLLLLSKMKKQHSLSD